MLEATCNACGEPLDRGECDNPWCERWRMAAAFDAVAPPVEGSDNG